MSTFPGPLSPLYPEIWADNFVDTTSFLIKPQFYLLSHIHSDHLNGLRQKCWNGGDIYCTHATKELLVKLMTRACRERQAHALHEGQYANGRPPVHRYDVPASDRLYKHVEQNLRIIPYNVPVELCIHDGHKLVNVRVTAIEAHHCPGSAMFLIESERGNALYTGDVRAEFGPGNAYQAYLQNHPSLLAYFCGLKQMDRIYLDTSLATSLVPRVCDQHVSAKALLLEIERLPADATVWLYTWTFGYECIWMAIAQTYKTKIHVSQYIYEAFVALQKTEYRGIIDILTTDAEATRFHACDSWNKCSRAFTKSIRCEPILEGIDEKPPPHKSYPDLTQQARRVSESKIVFSFARHSTIEELRWLVNLFQPKDIYPNVTDHNILDHASVVLRFKDLFRGNEWIQRLQKDLDDLQMIGRSEVIRVDIRPTLQTVARLSDAELDNTSESDDESSVQGTRMVILEDTKEDEDCMIDVRFKQRRKAMQAIRIYAESNRPIECSLLHTGYTDSSSSDDEAEVIIIDESSQNSYRTPSPDEPNEIKSASGFKFESIPDDDLSQGKYFSETLPDSQESYRTPSPDVQGIIRRIETSPPLKRKRQSD